MKKYEFHHLGIPTTEKKEGEEFHDLLGYKFYQTPFGVNPYGVQWLRFPENHGMPEILTRLPHIAFKVEDLDAEIEGKDVLFGPYEPLEGFRVAMILDDGIPVELIETDIDDETLAKMDAEVSCD